ncbi:CE1759 family FMN reductase [Lentzea sp. CA-135723]|uniref:CE1759 family FMN reductase n=1 Tax=Lentzea sp. CA-135723 TaxID=3239950 RepID=UPI003D947561
MRLAVVTAGLRHPSSTRLLADRLAAGVLAALGATAPLTSADVTVVETRDLGHDLVDHFVTGYPSEPLNQALTAVTEATGLIAVTPTISGSYSGPFKMFFDVFDKDALAGKPVLLGATGGTARHSLVLEHALRPLFAYLRADVVPTSVFAAPEDWSGAAAPDVLHGRVQRAAAELTGRMIAQEYPVRG